VVPLERQPGRLEIGSRPAGQRVASVVVCRLACLSWLVGGGEGAREGRRLPKLPARVRYGKGRRASRAGGLRGHQPASHPRILMRRMEAGREMRGERRRPFPTRLSSNCVALDPPRAERSQAHFVGLVERSVALKRGQREDADEDAEGGRGLCLVAAFPPRLWRREANKEQYQRAALAHF